MGEETKIEWCDHSWSPWRGCTKVSPGCANCYAETLSKRNPAVLGEWGKGRPRVLAKSWNEPVRWNRAAELGECKFCGGRRDTSGTGNCKACGDVKRIYTHPTVFPSLCDWLDDEVPVECLAKFLQLIHDTPNLCWLLLTKRPENWEQRLRDVCVYLQRTVDRHVEHPAWRFCDQWLPWNGVQRTPPPANVWVGTSVEDQTRANERIPALLRIPAVGRFLSVEPLLGPVDLQMMRSGGLLGEGEPWLDCLRGRAFDSHGDGTNTESIHWVIIGGESGHGARPCNVEWIRSLVSQCQTASVPVFVKQVGKHCEAGDLNLAPLRVDFDESTDISWLHLTHPKGGDPAEWPEDLRVREFPEGLR